MFSAVIQRVGAISLIWAQSLIQMADILVGTGRAVVRLSFLNPACKRVIIRHADAAAVNNLVPTVLLALVLGSITVHYLLGLLTSLGAYDQIGEYLVDIMLHQMAPLTVALLLMLRTGTTTMAEVASMSIRGELQSLKAMGISLDDCLYLPRVAAFVLAGPCLTLAFAVVGLLGGFLIMGYMQDITFANYLDQLSHSLTLADLMHLFLKPLLLSAAAAAISIQRGLCARSSLDELPRLMIRGLMYALGSIVTIEIVFSLVG